MTSWSSSAAPRASTARDLAPGALPVTAASAGAALDVFPDPSNDRLSEAQPFRGELSFVVPRREEAVIALSAYPGQPVFVVPSPGEEARALAGWIALAVLSLVVLIAAMTGTVLLLTWRLGLGSRFSRFRRIRTGWARPEAPGPGRRSARRSSAGRQSHRPWW